MLDESLKIGGSGVSCTVCSDEHSESVAEHAESVDLFLTKEETSLAALLEGRYSMPTIGHHFFEPMPSMTVEERLSDYRGIPEHLLTAHTRHLIHIGDLREYFLQLTPRYIRRHLDEVKTKAQDLVRLTYEAMSLFTRDGFLPTFAIQRLVDETFAGGEAGNRSIAMVWDLHMRPLNDADKSKVIGDWYLPRLRSWIQNNITMVQEAYAILTRPPTVVQAPHNTALIFVATNSDEGQRFLDYAYKAFEHFEDDMKIELEDAIRNGKLPRDIDVDSIRFQATAFYRHVDLVPGDDLELKIMDELADVMSTTAFLKSHGDSGKAAFEKGGITLYDPSALAELSTHMESTLAYFRAGKIGYVHLGEFIPPESVKSGTEIEREQIELHVRTNIPHEVGEVSRPWNLRDKGGDQPEWDAGDIEHFTSILMSILKDPSLLSKRFLLRRLKAEVSKLTSLAIHLGELARRDPQFRLQINAMREWHGKPADFFLEELGKAIIKNGWHPNNIYFIAAEGDDAGKFARKYQPEGPSDEHFQTVSWIAFKVAKKMGLPAPFVAREGDQWRLAIVAPCRSAAMMFAKLYQNEVHRHFEHMEIDVEGGTKGLTLSMSVYEAPNLLDPRMAKRATPLLRRMAKHAEDVKHANGWKKEGIDWLSRPRFGRIFKGVPTPPILSTRQRLKNANDPHDFMKGYKGRAKAGLRIKF